MLNINLNDLHLNLNKWDEGNIINNVTLKNNKITIDCGGHEYFFHKLYIEVFDYINNLGLDLDIYTNTKSTKIIIREYKTK